MFEGLEELLHAFWTWALDVRCQPHASAALPPGESPDADWVREWEGPCTDLKAVEKCQIGFAGSRTVMYRSPDS